MRKTKAYFMNLCLAGCLAMTQLSACSQSSETSGDSTTNASVTESLQGSQASSGSDSEMVTYEDTTITVQLGENQKKSVTYLAEDLDGSWDEASSTMIKLDNSGIQIDGDGIQTEDNRVIIRQAGTYVVSGSMDDVQILIEAEKDSVVRLVLHGVEISNKTTAPIYSSEKCKVILTLADETRNIVTDSAEYQFSSADEDEPNAPIFTRGDLSINGNGELEVQGNFECGIRSKGNLLIGSGNITVTAAEDGMKGKDSIVIRDGIFHIVSGKDGLKSNNDEEADKGYIWIDGGEFTITAEDDGIQAETALMINDGTIDITDCQEALAGKSVDIFGGLIKAYAQDDGINSAGPAETEAEKMMDQEGVYTRIVGGNLWINALADGIDSNGDLYLEGGTLYLSGSTNEGNGIIDYNGTSILTGGTMFASGSAGMMQTFGKDPTQNYLVVYYPEKQEAGTLIQLLDADGKELGSFAPEKEFSAVIITSPELETGDTCQLVTGTETLDITVNEQMTTAGDVPKGRGGIGGPGGRGGHGFQGGQRPEGMTPPDDGEFPEGMTPPDDGQFPEGMTPPDDGQFPEGMTPPGGKRPEDMKSQDGRRSDEVPADSETKAAAAS